ncbi:hypothetical protein HK405_007122 [Cladochytrium tenue]|nr:hypothetical protein HK405_007122 [Cladochytrium tenue]
MPSSTASPAHGPLGKRRRPAIATNAAAPETNAPDAAAAVLRAPKKPRRASSSSDPSAVAAASSSVGAPTAASAQQKQQQQQQQKERPSRQAIAKLAADAIDSVARLPALVPLLDLCTVTDINDDDVRFASEPLG